MNYSGDCVPGSGQNRETTKRIKEAFLATAQYLQEIGQAVDRKIPKNRILFSSLNTTRIELDQISHKIPFAQRLSNKKLVTFSEGPEPTHSLYEATRMRKTRECPWSSINKRSKGHRHSNIPRFGDKLWREFLYFRGPASFLDARSQCR
jgi:hypothetical protein